MATGTYDAGSMPTNYDSEANATSTIIDKEWMNSMNGILKVAQICSSMLTFICATVWPTFAAEYGGHWVQFSCLLGLIYSILSFYTSLFFIRQKIAMTGFQVNFSVVSVVVIICSSVNFPDKYGGGWVEFVCITSAVMIPIRYMMYIFRLPEKLSPKTPFYFVELVIYGILTLFYFISAIVCSVFGANSASIGAAAFFTWVATILFGADVYFALGKWRGSGEGPRFGGGSSSSGPTGSAATASGNVNLPADPYNPATVTPNLAGVEKGLPPQY
ncbi:hypothetical protein CAPTEDRAFT_224513 [Capitella teleta]|uniref:MARVEL domain-containing protein n=1 Tax=Capitella teleta TaxID=283909 RepID=R7TZQ1_CAPTE|nr:hypothetical protein CAPTEDRAFT_224513 [Capitella teleta]|eukprot:ELT96866.1 hypothetical protein CAPTEDRAFT_224513 [Capitella teleta]